MSGEPAESVDVTVAPGYRVDPFRKRLAGGILVGGGLLFALILAGCFWILVGSENDKAQDAAQTVLTTSIGFLASILTTIVNFFFQQRD